MLARLATRQRLSVLRVLRRNFAKSSTTKAEAAASLRVLNAQIREHNMRYYSRADPEVSDDVFDGLVREKLRLEALYPALKTPLGVGSAPIASTNQRRFEHPPKAPMLSLDNCNSKEALGAFVRKVGHKPSSSLCPFVVEPKVDGLSLAVRYCGRSGALLAAGTRGDGSSGEDVTLAARRLIGDLPASIPVAGLMDALPGVSGEAGVMVEVRGEAYMAVADFDRLNKRRAEVESVRRGGGKGPLVRQLSSPRNAAAGSLLRLPEAGEEDGEGSDGARLGFFAYQLLVYRGDGSGLVQEQFSHCVSSQVQVLQLLRRLGFSVALPYFVVAAPTTFVTEDEHLLPPAVSELISANPPSKPHENLLVEVLGPGDNDTRLLAAGAASAGFPSVEEAVWAACTALGTRRMDSLPVPVQAPARQLPYEIDGAVVKLNSFASQQVVGSSNRCPRWAMAFKYSSEEAVTTLRQIQVQVGRMGALTPVAELSPPVRIAGALISHATLHNELEVNRLGLRAGSRVIVQRAGDVIPRIVGRADDPEANDTMPVPPEPYKLPGHCPVCASPVVQDALLGEEEEGLGQGQGSVVRRCSGGVRCPAQLSLQISHFCSRAAADIRGMGPSKVQDLVYMGKLSSIADLYTLRSKEFGISSASSAATTTKKKQQQYTPFSRSRVGATGLSPATVEDFRYDGQLWNCVGYSDKSLQNTFDSIDARRAIPFERFLFGLGIRFVGQQTARTLALAFKDFHTFWRLAKDASKGAEFRVALEQTPGLGAHAIENLLGISSREDCLYSVANVDALLQHIRVLPVPANGANDSRKSALSGVPGAEKHVGSAEVNPLAGKRLVFTGRLSAAAWGNTAAAKVLGSKLPTRSQMEQWCESLGAEIDKKVNSKTSVLVALGGSPSSGAAGQKASLKSQKAAELGDVLVWDVSDFTDLLARHAIILPPTQ